LPKEIDQKFEEERSKYYVKNANMMMAQ